MKNIAENIRAEINNRGGMKAFASAEKKERPAGCPMIKTMKKEISESLTREEIYIAFRLGLIGNNGHAGSIVENSKS